MEIKTTAKFIKRLLILQILIVIGIAICEIIQLAEINKYQQVIIDHRKDWDYLIGYTDDTITILAKVYHWIVILITLGVLGWSLISFEKRWANLQDYSDKSMNIWLFVLWCITTIPNIIALSNSNNGIKSCSQSSYTYQITPRLLRHCNAYLASLLLAYVLVLLIIIQLLFHFVMVKHQKKIINIKQPPVMEEPKLKRVRRSRRVSRKRNSLKSAFSNSTRLSIVTEDEEERGSNRSGESGRSIRFNRKRDEHKSKFRNERRVYSNV